MEPDPEFRYDDPEYADTQRASITGTDKTRKEMLMLQRDPKEYALNQLRKEVFEFGPFIKFLPYKTDIVNRLEKFPDLHVRNIQLLVAASLFWLLHPKGIDQGDFLEFHKQFTGLLEKVDLLRYIRLIDLFREK